MAEQIRVDKEILKTKCDEMKKLIDKQELKNAIATLDGLLAESSGDSVTVLLQCKTELLGFEKNLMLIFERTLEFLQNKHGDFVKADEQM